MGPETHSIGSYRTREVKAHLVFPETRQALMAFHQTTCFEVLKSTRFFERRFRWTGSGVIDPPRVTGTINGVPTEMHRHGPIYQNRTFSAYLVDLGAFLEPGTDVSITTVGRFVDETGTFEPVLAIDVRPGIDRVEMGVTFRTPPTELKAHFFHDDGRNRDHPQELALEVRQEESTSEVHSVKLEAPSPGRYEIRWPKDRMS